MTFSPSFSQNFSRLLPVPVIELRDRSWTNTSAFDGSTLNGFEEVWVRNPDLTLSVFDPSNQPLLEMEWYRRRTGTGWGRQGRVENQGWAAPDDGVIKLGSDQGGGGQTVQRRSKWDVTSTKDFQPISGARIELEHYFKLSRVTLLEDDAGTTSVITIPVPTFIAPSRFNKKFSISQFDPERSVARYQGYQNGYFRFFYSIKDPQGKHPGDRVSGARSGVIQVQASTPGKGFPIWPASNGFAKGVDTEYLKAFLV